MPTSETRTAAVTSAFYAPSTCAIPCSALAIYTYALLVYVNILCTIKCSILRRLYHGVVDASHNYVYVTRLACRT